MGNRRILRVNLGMFGNALKRALTLSKPVFMFVFSRLMQPLTCRYGKIDDLSVVAL